MSGPLPSNSSTPDEDIIAAELQRVLDSVPVCVAATTTTATTTAQPGLTHTTSVTNATPTPVLSTGVPLPGNFMGHTTHVFGQPAAPTHPVLPAAQHLWSGGFPWPGSCQSPQIPMMPSPLMGHPAVSNQIQLPTYDRSQHETHRMVLGLVAGCYTVGCRGPGVYKI